MDHIPPPLPEDHSAFQETSTFTAKVPLGRKLVFWLLLGVQSVIFAEVSCASSPYPFFDAWGLLVVTPLYTLHTLFLAGLIYQRKHVTLTTLLLAGMLFGLYEALITKVIWDPTWGEKTSMLGGVAWEQTSVLVFFWHPWFAFILPLAFGERLFTNGGEVWGAFPDFLKGKCSLVWLVLLALLLGLHQGANTASVDATLLSTAEALGVFVVFSLLWKWVNKGKGVLLRDLLPRGRNLVVIGLLLGLLYLLSAWLIRPEALPRTVLPYLIVFAMYLITATLLIANLKSAAIAQPIPRLQTGRFPWLPIGLFVAAYLLSVIVFHWIKPVTGVLILLLWGLGILFAFVQIVRATLLVFKPSDKG